MNDIQLLKELISIPSYVDNSTNEKEIADFLLSYLKENLPWLKIETQQVEEERYNIIASNSDNPAYVFISHMDTVLPSSESQLEPLEKIGKLYGLGAGDMKSGLVASIKAVEEVGENSSVALIFDVDEEYYFKGVNKLVEKYSFSPKLAIFPEPSDGLIVNGCRGVIEIMFDVIGRTAHAGKPFNGINAIEKAVLLTNKLKYLLSSKYGIDDNFGESTLNLAAINGGKLRDGQVVTQANAVPDVARVLIDIRPSSNEIDANAVVEAIKYLANKIRCEASNFKINLNYKSYKTEKSTLKDFEQLLGNNYTQNLGDGGFFEAAIVANAWDCSCISYGPIGTSHVLDEYVDIQSFFNCKSNFKELLKS